MPIDHTHVTASETGESPFAVRITMKGHVIVGDEPVDAGGGDLGPSPFDLLSASLAECTAMTVRWFARQRDWPLEHVEVAVDYATKPAADAPLPAVFKKTVSIRGARLSADQRSRLLEIAGKCPVQKLLESSLSIDMTAGPMPGQIAK